MAGFIECQKCGTIVSSKQKICPNCHAKLKKKTAWYTWLVLIIILVIVFVPWKYFDYIKTPVKAIRSLAQSGEEHVIAVKNAEPNSYPGITYGEAFDEFFGAPTWIYSQGSEKGSNELIDYVEFTGFCSYDGKNVKVTIQFPFNKDGTGFAPGYCAFNDISQNELFKYAVLDKAFSSYKEGQE